MRNIICIFFFLFNLLLYSNNTKKIIVALSLTDCANCSIILNQLNQKLNKPKMTFIFRSELEPDSLLVYKRTGLNNFNSVVKFSDELYEKYSIGPRSMINIVKNNSVIYSSLLLELDIDDFLNKYDNKTEMFCFNNLKKGVPFIQNDYSLIIHNPQLKRWSYYDQSNSVDIIADDSWVKKAYEIYYKDEQEVTEKFNDYKALLKELSSIMPEAKKCIKIKTNKLVFLTDVSFLEKKYEKKNIDVIKKYFLITYGIDEKGIIDIKYINTENQNLNKKYIIAGNDFHILNEEYIFPIKPYSTFSKESKFLSVFMVNKKNPSELILKEVLNKNIPNNYIEYKLNNNFHDYNFHEEFVLLKFGEFIYDYKNNIQYNIPFAKSEFNTLSTVVSDAYKTGVISSYYIRDIFSNDDESLFLLYKDSSKNLKQMEINKKTDKILKDYIILTADELKDYKNNSSFTFNEKREILYLNNDNCILKL